MPISLTSTFSFRLLNQQKDKTQLNIHLHSYEFNLLKYIFRFVSFSFSINLTPKRRLFCSENHQIQLNFPFNPKLNKTHSNNFCVRIWNEKNRQTYHTPYSECGEKNSMYYARIWVCGCTYRCVLPFNMKGKIFVVQNLNGLHLVHLNGHVFAQ